MSERERNGPYATVDELAARVPVLQKDEARQLARVGALNGAGATHRRDALWQVEAAVRRAGPLLAGAADEGVCPLEPMTDEERQRADYDGTGLHLGAHPMARLREQLADLRPVRSDELAHVRDGATVWVAGAVICRQRPGTARGFLFLSLEDEAGLLNLIVAPDLYEQDRAAWTGAAFLAVEGIVQNQQGVVAVRARRVRPLPDGSPGPGSRDFH